MQRTALIPLVEWAKNFKENRPIKTLEVGCGTGRFMTFVRDNLPHNTESTVLDLSPFYLEKARENDRQWRSITDVRNRNRLKPLRTVQGKGEDLPFNNEEFDVVMCMYMYHEIPQDIRAKVSAEMSRVTKAGGIIILTDSIQKGDRPVADNTMGNFEDLNEPYYRNYIEDFLPKHFEVVGMECLSKTICSSTKTLSFRKPKA